VVFDHHDGTMSREPETQSVKLEAFGQSATDFGYTYYMQDENGLQSESPLSNDPVEVASHYLILPPALAQAAA
jgi:hypothetical protein